MVAGLQLADAQTSAFMSYFKTHKSYRQYSDGIPVFQGGAVELFLTDGAWVHTVGCALDPSPVDFGPSPDPENCNIGATGILIYLNGPDVNPADGVVDPQFWEVLSVITASRVEPGRADKIALQAKPYSDFPLSQGQPLPGILDGALTVYFSLLADNWSEIYLDPYELAAYQWVRTYNDLEQMDDEIIPGGQYQFRYPRVNAPNVIFGQSFGIRPAPEGYVKKPVKGGFRFINVAAFNGQGFAQYDSRVVNILQWEGIISTALTGSEQLYLSFRAAGNDGIDPAGPIVFPPGDTGSQIRLPQGVAQTSFDIPPGLFGNGKKLIAELVFSRPEFMGAGNQQPARRVFQLPIQFLASFSGFTASYFSASTPLASKAADADPDGDGIANWIEWLAGTDPTTANAPKNLSGLSFVPPSAVKSDEPSGGFWQMTLDREPGLPPNAVDVQISSDLKTWTTLSSTDPDWKKDDNADLPYIRIISKNPELAGKRYFRVKYNKPLIQ